MFSPARAIYNLQFTLQLLIFCLPRWMKVSQEQGFLSGFFTAVPRPQLRALCAQYKLVEFHFPK